MILNARNIGKKYDSWRAGSNHQNAIELLEKNYEFINSRDTEELEVIILII